MNHFPHPKPKLSQLEILIAVTDTGGFGSAAAELGCTQSRVSHAISELEATLGTRLLQRSRTGCSPTEAGRRVLAGAREIVLLSGGLGELARGEAASVTGQVRIACFRSVSTHLLPHALAALATDHPGLRIDVDDSHEDPQQVQRAVDEGQADIGIVQLLRAAPVEQVYACDEYVLVVPDALGSPASLSWRDLAAKAYIQLDCAGARAVAGRCRAAGFDVWASRTVATDTGVLAMVRHGIGFSILPHLAVYPSPQGVGILKLPIAAPRRFAVVTQPSHTPKRAVQVAVRVLRDREVLARSAAYQAGIVRWA